MSMKEIADKTERPVKSNRAWREECESLRQQLAECQANVAEVPQICRRYEQQLAECLAQVKQAKREALLEAADYYQKRSGSHAYDFDIADELRNMAKELE